MRYKPSSLLVIALVGVACSSSSGEPSPDGTDANTNSDSHIVDGETGLTGLTAELAALRETNGGTLALPDALDFFASTLGEIPGGDATRFEPRVGDATMALWQVGAHWEELTTEQQQAVGAALGYPRPQSLMATIASPAEVALQAQIDTARAAIAGLLGVDLAFPVTGELVAGLSAILPGHTTPSSIGAVTWAERGGEHVYSGQAEGCRIAFNADEVPNASTVAHEVFHCFQFQLVPDLAVSYASELWIIEGSAEWVGATIGGVDALVVQHYGEWIANTGSLFGLDYAAMGYFWVLESMGVSPWSVIEVMLNTGGIEAVAASGLDPSAVLNRADTSSARRAMAPSIPVSAVWDFAVANVPDRASRTPVTVSPDSPLTSALAREDFARGPNELVTLEGGDRVQVAVDSDVGTLEFFGKDPIEWQSSLHPEFCLQEGGCTCGIDGAVDSGLGEGTRDLILTGGALAAGSINYDVRIPDPGTAFTDGHWQGTLTYTVVGIAADGIAGTLTQSSGAIEVTVADGAVTGGSFELGIPGEFNTTGAHAEGTYITIAAFGGCGFSPQVTENGVSFAGTVTTSSGVTVPFSFDLGFSPTEGGPGTLWRIDPVTDPNRRTGEIDTIADQAVRGATGWTVTDVTWTFEMSLSG